MATIRQIKVKDITYDISPSPSGTLDTTTKEKIMHLLLVTLLKQVQLLGLM